MRSVVWPAYPVFFTFSNFCVKSSQLPLESVDFSLVVDEVVGRIRPFGTHPDGFEAAARQAGED